ncbi:hypothetical protein Calag_0449 [Caldisphaera lagunensis DSM 15908]|uniref:Transcription factor Pcc1 n=1 Tax=Caldisphaera lagunensis (strain DSM 15908 / JCM 11604 / ANMR 0165 / IC-154) TaxID=1056495 RepID=L0A8Q1_CALLD|nr:KEOPS complex subunit Pcc1 [Caldisphaera lagunensis]AFZ70216.1 hypothetical protein Calag_0449 [Caldisphaera lagunensis DSM 15908]
MDKDSVECTAELVIPNKDANAIAKSLTPDNIKDLPSYLDISCKNENDKLICTIRIKDCKDPKRIMSLKNTLDDLLINIRSIIDSMNI